ncbi:MAG: 4-hydroxy-tetrahydrodipicolinate synthase, partial [Gammaproteobacteria bacterium]|nr:4-hydroxy-tetrahydrodipicolinate synthase [Gammaproteobacteria bacterium]
SLVALVTPFNAKDQVDYGALARLIEFHIAEGSDGLVIAGTTGESATLEKAEHAELIRRSVEIAAGRLPIIAGTGSNSTAQTIGLSREVAGCGIAAFLIVVPYYNKPTQEGLYRHFSAIADAADRPILMYNVPGRTVADMLPDTVARLSGHGNIFGIKEATGNLDRLREIQDRVGDEFRLYSGDDFTLRQFIEQGGHGVVTVSGNVAPAAVAKLCRLSASGEAEAALALDETLQPLNKALFVESNPIPVKWAVAEMGLIEPHIRLPLTPYSEQHHAGMRAAMAGVGA